MYGNMGGKVDIYFVAKKAGVSPATVSRVLNGSKPVSPQLCARVMDCVARYRYRPNSMARGLSTRRSNLIGVVASTMAGAFHAALLSGIEQQAGQRGYNVLVSNTAGDAARHRESFSLLWERRVDGILLSHETSWEQLRELLAAAPLATVLAGIHIKGAAVPGVSVDDEQGAYEMASHLIALGHREIGAVFNDCYSLNVLRRRGFERALGDSGLRPRAEWMLVGDCSYTAGAEAARRIFSGPRRPTALFCVCDEQAVGAINYLLDAGLRVPEDVSVTGYDGIELGGLLRPRLTTVAQPIEEIGRAAATLLIDMLEGGAAAGQPESLVLPHQMLTRGSTAPPPGT